MRGHHRHRARPGMARRGTAPAQHLR
jgi:hypothetical protein